MIPFVDTHCHLDLIKDIQKDPSSEDKQPIKTISVTNVPFLFPHNQHLFKSSRNIRVALGMHPELVASYSGQFNEFVKYLAETKYIGEVGLDGSEAYQSSFRQQKEILEQMLLQCKEVNNKILTVHSRNATTETISILNKNLKGSNCKVILHWFSGTLSELKQAVDFEYYFSINHRMVFSEKGRQIINAIPRHLILTETDAPFTFNHIVKNRRQSLEETIKVIAKIKSLNGEEMKKYIYDNFVFLLKSVQ